MKLRFYPLSIRKFALRTKKTDEKPEDTKAYRVAVKLGRYLINKRGLDNLVIFMLDETGNYWFTICMQN